MNKKLTLFCIIFCLSLFKSQNISSGKWSDLFSYNNVLVLREDTDRIIAATENGIFYFTPSTGEIKKLSKANGLHDVKISAFDYNPITKIGLIGYVSGAIDVVTPEGISLVVDIPIATGYSGIKKINHISISGNDAIISAGYGVSIFKLDKKEFADTVFFNDSGVFTAANESVIKDNVVYSATSNGVKSHAMDVSFPIYSSWATSVEGNFTQISSNDFIYAGTSTEVFKGSGVTFSSFKTGFTGIKDIITNNSTVLVADTQNVSRFDSSGTLQKTINIGQNINTALQFKNQIYTETASMNRRSLAMQDRGALAGQQSGAFSLNETTNRGRLADTLAALGGAQSSAFNSASQKNSARGQTFSQQQDLARLGLAGTQAGANAEQNAVSTNNTSRGQALAQLLAERQLPMQEYQQLMGTSQAVQPNLNASYGTPGLAGTDLLGAYGAQNGNILKQQSINNQESNDLLGSLFKLGGMFL